MRSYIAEAIGTFFLVFAGTGAIIINDISNGAITHVGIAMTFGLIVTVLIYALGEISGAHFNPAVTFGFWLAKRFPSKKIFPYLGSQFVGGILASIALRILFPVHPTLGITVPHGSIYQSLIIECILTCLLVFVILNVTSGSKEKGLLAGVAIGGTVGLEALFAGPICGASMNPIRSLAPALISNNLNEVWIYLVAPMAGSMIAVTLYKVVKEQTQEIL